MLIELHDAEVARLIRHKGLLYGDFATTAFHPTRHFITLHELIGDDGFIHAVLNALDSDKTVALAERLAGIKGVGLLATAQAVYGLGWAAESLLIGQRIAAASKIGYGFVDYPKPIPVSHAMLAGTILGRPIEPGEHVFVLADVSVTGTGIGAACDEIGRAGGNPVAIVVAARGRGRDLSKGLPGLDVVVLCDSEDLGLPFGPETEPLDGSRLQKQADALRSRGWFRERRR